LFSCIAASKLCTLHIKTPLTTKTYMSVTIDNNEKFLSVCEKVAKDLKVPVTSIKITKGRQIPHRCMTLKENHIHNNDRLLLTFINSKAMPETNDLYRYNPGRMMKKPVIYIYPTEEIEATVSVHPEGEFTAVYPSFTDKKNNEWKVHASPSGKLLIDDREYTSLFWEADHKTFVPTFETGFIVTKENAVAFLEEKLRILGLTDLEANEFITFWVPVLNKNGKSVVSFQFDNYEKAAPLAISPKPDTIIRVFLGIRKAEDNEQIKEQVLPTYKRQGYTVVEWGGCDI